jgi:hypothetical protein
MVQFCTKCGAQNGLDAKFCEQCGATFRPPVVVVTQNSPTPGAPHNLRRAMLLTLGFLGLCVVGALAWSFLNTNRPSESTFTKVLNAYYASNYTATEGLSCLTNLQYSRNPIYANPWDLGTRAWLNELVSVGLYAGPEQVSTGRSLFVRQQLRYDRTELGHKAVRNGKLCFADGVKVTKIVSFTNPQKIDGRDATVVAYMIDFVNQADWSKQTKLQEQVKGKIDASVLERRATLVLGDKGWEWIAEGDRLDASSGGGAQHISSSGGFFAGINERFGSLFSSGPDVVLKEFYRNVERGNVDAAIAGMSQEYVAMLGPDKLRHMIKGEREKVAAQGGIDSIQTETKIEGTKAGVRAVIKYKNGREKIENSRMIKENGKWKVGG